MMADEQPNAFQGALAMAGYDPELEEEMLDTKRSQAEEVQGVLRQVRERIMAQSGPSRGEKLLALSAGLGAPTRTGSIGEGAGNVSRSLAPVARAQREHEERQAGQLGEVDLALARADDSVVDAEYGLYTMNRQLQNAMALEAFKSSSTGAGGVRDQKIADYRRLGHNFATAVGLADGKIRIEIVPETGNARLINELGIQVDEVPLGMLDIDDARPGGPGAGLGPSGENPPMALPFSQGETAIMTPEETLAAETARSDMAEGKSLWEMAEQGTGLASALLERGSYISNWFGGKVAAEHLQARQALRIRSRDAATALVENPRMPVALVEMALEDVAMSPNWWKGTEVMRNEMISLDTELWDRLLDAQEDKDDPNLPEDFRSDQEQNFEGIQTILRDLAVPTQHQRRRTRDPETNVPPPGVDPNTWKYLTHEQRVIVRQEYGR